MLWPAWSIRLIPASRTAPNALNATRTALAVLTLIPGTRLTNQQADRLLGQPTGTAGANTVLTSLPTDQQITTIRLLTQLAGILDTNPAPIDYTRRRALFANSDAIVDRDDYAALAARHGWRPPSPLQLRILDHHLAVALTGTHAHARPARADGADAWNPLLATLPAAARAFVRAQAGELLNAHGIDEPVSWQPPPPQIPDADWPGVAPETVDADQFAHAVARHAFTPHGLARISETAGISGLHARLYTQILDLTMPEQQWDALAEATPHDLLDPARLRHLYHSQELALRDIARLSLTTERVVRRTLTDAGTTLLPNRPREVRISRRWFDEHYLNTTKTVRQAAAEAGHSPETLRKRARELGIPFGRHATPFNPFASWPVADMPPPAVVAACSGPRGIQYVKHVLQMTTHPTRRAAAHALNLTGRMLDQQRRHVETAAGFRIFTPGAPLTPTPQGVAFLRAAADAIHRLDCSKTSD